MQWKSRAKRQKPEAGSSDGRTTQRKSKLVVSILALSACAAAVAQSPTYNLGRTPSAEELRAWDISIGPEGKELPPGSGAAGQGAKIYAQKCARCHGPTGTEGRGGPPLMAATKGARTIGTTWPYATTLWDYINRTMPFKEPPSLSADDVYSLTAFLLFRYGIIKEDDVMDSKSLPKVQMPNRNGYLPAHPEWKPGTKKPFGVYP